MGFLNLDQTDPEVWTVAELTGYIKELFEIDFRLRDLDVSGEISNFTRARSGHLYFTLKDEDAQLKCVMWRSAAERLRFEPREGDSVIVHGRVSVYEASGVYQLYAEEIDPAGRGDLALAFERLRERLSAEGLFDHEHKQPIPAFPRKIGLVTSADAAALRDILNVLQRRAPLVSILLAPTLVQGTEAPAQIIRSLRWLDGRDDIDLIIVARGGGSTEDLWAFNDEGVARAIYDAQHPIISGVGHETDFTIADFVADLRAPTPSAAAELAVPDLTGLAADLQAAASHMASLVKQQIEQAGWQLRSAAQSLQMLSPKARLDSYLQRVDTLQMRLEQSMNRRMEQALTSVALLDSKLQAVSPQATLQRGYAIVKRADGSVVASIKQVQSSDRLDVQLVDGSFAVVVEDKD